MMSCHRFFEEYFEIREEFAYFFQAGPPNILDLRLEFSRLTLDIV